MKQRSTIFTLAMVLMLLASMVFQVAPASALAGTYFTTTDNENNAHTGVADGDMDVDIYNTLTNEPIEFNINVPVGGLPTNEAILAIYAYDVDEEAGQKDQVFLNGTSLGFLSGNNNVWSTTAFVIPTGLLVEGNNLVFIDVDTLTPGTINWLVRVDWGQIVVDGGVGTPGRINSVIINSSSVASGTVTLNVSVTVEALSSGNFRLETNLVSPTGTSPSANTQSFSMTAGQIVSYPVTLTYPVNTASGQFVIRGNLFDNTTGVLNSSKITAFNHVINVGPDASPTITGLLPNHGPVAGGTSVVISGTTTGPARFTLAAGCRLHGKFRYADNLHHPGSCRWRSGCGYHHSWRHCHICGWVYIHSTPIPEHHEHRSEFRFSGWRHERSSHRHQPDRRNCHLWRHDCLLHG